MTELKDIEQVLEGIRPEFNFAGSQDFMADGMLDSYDMMMLVAELERVFGITIAGVDITPENFRNLNSVERLVGKYQAA